MHIQMSTDKKVDRHIYLHSHIHDYSYKYVYVNECVNLNTLIYIFIQRHKCMSIYSDRHVH